MKPEEAVKDVDQFMNTAREKGWKMKKIQLMKSDADLLMLGLGCKNIEELIAYHKENYPVTENYQIIVL